MTPMMHRASASAANLSSGNSTRSRAVSCHRTFTLCGFGCRLPFSSTQYSGGRGSESSSCVCACVTGCSSTALTPCRNLPAAIREHRVGTPTAGRGLRRSLARFRTSQGPSRPDRPTPDHVLDGHEGHRGDTTPFRACPLGKVQEDASRCHALLAQVESSERPFCSDADERGRLVLPAFVTQRHDDPLFHCASPPFQ